MKINSKIHFIIEQNVMHITLTTTLKRIIKKNDTEHKKIAFSACPNYKLYHEIL